MRNLIGREFSGAAYESFCYRYHRRRWKGDHYRKLC